jgi:hypothetical protein
VLRPCEQGLHRPVAAVAYPAIQIALHRVMLDESAESDALDASANDDMPDDARIAHVYAPVIAVLTITQL